MHQLLGFDFAGVFNEALAADDWFGWIGACVQGVFFMRRSSAGFGASQQGLGITASASVMQDFGGGGILIGLLLLGETHHARLSMPDKWSLLVTLIAGGALLLIPAHQHAQRT